MTVKENGQDKIEKICDLLKREALEPAEQQGRRIIEDAKIEAQKIIANADSKADELIKEAMKKIANETAAGLVALQEAHKQAIESLKQDIERKLFSPTLHSFVIEGSNGPGEIAALIKALAEAVVKEGTSSDFAAVVSSKVHVGTLNQAIGQEILNRLRDKSVQIGEMAGGMQMKLIDKKVTLDISDQALVELLGRHLRKDFRDKIFAKTKEL